MVRIQAKLGDQFQEFINSLEEIPPVSIRKNPFKPSELFTTEQKISWTDFGYYLPERISFTLDPLFHAGCYYVQEASSMFLEKVFKSDIADGPLKVLDLCAAPGGKSTHLLSLLPPGSLLVSNEIIPSRNKILQQNLAKWGCSNVIVTQNDVTDFSKLKGYFDVILIDAPCSGEGLFRKDPDAVNEWSTEAVLRCASRQTDIIEKVIPALREDGVLIYSTCTFEDEENDAICKTICNEHHFEKIEIKEPDPDIVKTDFGFQFYPHKIKGEGFFIAPLRKKSSAPINFNYPKNNFPLNEKKQLEIFLKEPEQFVPFRKNEELFAIPSFMKNDFSLVMNNLFVRQAGIHIGKVIHDAVVPAHRLALSVDAAVDLPEIHISREEAIRYLKCETISTDTSLEKGWYRVMYEKNALGWIKNIGNRINNYFPKELRILMK